VSEIVVYGNDVLTTKAANVEVFDEDLTRFIAEMHKAMIKAKGVGLAAPQIGVSKQIAIVDLSVGENPDELHILINPEIIEIDGVQKGEEGCLSFPDIVTVVERPNHVKLKTQNLAGDWIELEGEELLARAFCHEIDHLNGVLIIDRVSGMKRDMIKKRVQKRVKAGTWSA
jgi:peptide deformylase